MIMLARKRHGASGGKQEANQSDDQKISSRHHHHHHHKRWQKTTRSSLPNYSQYGILSWLSLCLVLCILMVQFASVLYLTSSSSSSPSSSSSNSLENNNHINNNKLVDEMERQRLARRKELQRRTESLMDLKQQNRTDKFSAMVNTFQEAEKKDLVERHHYENHENDLRRRRGFGMRKGMAIHNRGGGNRDARAMMAASSQNALGDNNNETHPHRSISGGGGGRGGATSKLSCDELFSYSNFQFVNNSTCLQHSSMPLTRACQLGSISIDTSKIVGSVGGEDIQDVLNRDDALEMLYYRPGALTYHQFYNSTFPFTGDEIQSYASEVIQLLKSGLVLDGRKVKSVRKQEEQQIHGTSSTTITTVDNNSTALLIKRGEYANPCMAILNMYNLYIILEKFNLLTNNNNNDDAEKSTTLIWLDGHAKGNLDGVWETLFGTKPLHVKQLGTTTSNGIGIDNTKKDGGAIVRFPNAVVVNTRSAVGDEGLKQYAWRHRTNNTSNCTLDPQMNTLIRFRDFVLQRFGIERQRATNTDTTTKRRLTFLVRRNYVAHPRSNGVADRTLANVESDLEYIKSIHPEYDDVSIVSFENSTFQEQLDIITQTDLLVAVHGAGNIHTLFLPDHAPFIEYFPKKYQSRRRFRFLSECLNRTYIAKRAWIEERVEDKTKVILRLKPRDAFEQSHEFWHETRPAAGSKKQKKSNRGKREVKTHTAQRVVG